MKGWKKFRINLLLATALLMPGTLFLNLGHAQAAPLPASPAKMEHSHKAGRFFKCHVVFNTAELLNMKPQALMEQLQTGKSLVQVVQASKGWNEAEYLSKLETATASRISKAVKDGKLSEEQASKIKQSLPAKLKEAIHHKWGRQDQANPGRGCFPGKAHTGHEAVWSAGSNSLTTP
ncbi:hypothetical protein DCC85_08380 [Paenibacillus sp. CAA11]|uniref:hypothetical protein n=1 Tax=Paenibacillus sp. CAA11 TaxID=1532905 RepID=UPI000D3B1ACA|nr:hypothetical protein [Paenibacillus sp. CAA11]AWB44229.1 hypothetical protein DCC85_08380 [Paenibacillus sp. CAA11]